MHYISLLCPVYNSSKYLHITLDSIVNLEIPKQTMVQIILLDDGSKDDSFEIMQAYAKKYNFIEIHRNKTNQGVGKTRNKLLELAKGEYLCFVDSDDLYHRKKLIMQFALITNNPNIDLVAHNLYPFRNIADVEKHISRPLLKQRTRPHSYLYGYLFFGCPFSMASIMIKRSFLIKHKIRFKENCHVSEDYEFYTQIAISGAKMVKLPYQMHYYRRHHTQLSQRKLSQLIDQQNTFMAHWYACHGLSFEPKINALLLSPTKPKLKEKEAEVFIRYFKKLLRSPAIDIRARYRIFKEAKKTLQKNGFLNVLRLIF